MERQPPYPPFTDDEKRFVLTEALKNSTVPLDRLLTVIRDGNLAPTWDLMLLPQGRNLKSCFDEFHALLASQAQQHHTPFYHGQQPIASSSTKRKSAPDIFDSTQPAPPAKRRQSGLDIMSTTRDIRPKPPNGAPSPLSVATTAAPEPKKRGRPSKEAIAQRQAEAVARGEVIPALQAREHVGGGGGTPYTMIAPSPPIQQASLYSPGPATPLERKPPEQGLGDLPAPASVKRRRAQRPRAPKSPNPGESSFPVKQTIAPAPPGEQKEAPPTAPILVAPVAAAPVGGSTEPGPKPTLSAASEAPSIPAEPPAEPQPRSEI